MLSTNSTSMMEGSGSLEQQLEALRLKAVEVRARRVDLKKIEELGALLEEHLILDNRYTEHSTVGLAQQWDQLDQLSMRMQHNLEQQIQARNHSGVSEDSLKEFSMMFKHFDKDKSGKLNQQEFKSCLRALGYDLPMVEEGQPDPEFEAILDVVDPNRDGYVSLQEYIAFMISKETENVQSYEEIENAFRAITASERPYVTKEELYSVSVSLFTGIFKIESDNYHSECAEPHQGHGRLLHQSHESVRGPQDRSQHQRRPRLHRLYAHVVPELNRAPARLPKPARNVQYLLRTQSEPIPVFKANTNNKNILFVLYTR